MKEIKEFVRENGAKEVIGDLVAWAGLVALVFMASVMWG